MKEPVSGWARLREGEAAYLSLSCRNVKAEAWGQIPQAAKNQPMSEEKVRRQLGKTGGTPFFFEDLSIDIQGNLFFPVQALNELRRECFQKLEEKGEKFDVVILDPPAFTKSRNSIKNAVKGYREINLRAMKLVKDGGFLATCSCSHFMDYELFTKTIGQAAKNVHKRLRQVEYRTQAPDHPILWAADESYYLKFYIFQVCNDR